MTLPRKKNAIQTRGQAQQIQDLRGGRGVQGSRVVCGGPGNFQEGSMGGLGANQGKKHQKTKNCKRGGAEEGAVGPGCLGGSRRFQESPGGVRRF